MQTVATFHVLNGEAIEGPYTAGQLRILEEKGTISGQTQIARHGEAEWLPLEVWREVIHGAPTHRGAAPVLSAKRRTADRGEWLPKAALIVALAGVGLIFFGLSREGPATWAGLGVFGIGLVLWVLGASRK